MHQVQGFSILILIHLKLTDFCRIVISIETCIQSRNHVNSAKNLITQHAFTWQHLTDTNQNGNLETYIYFP